MNTVVREGIVNSDQFTYDNTVIKTLFADQRVFAFIGNHDDTSYEKYGNWKSCGPVLSKEGTVPVYGKSSSSEATWIQTFIPKNNKHPEATAAFLSYITSEEGQQLAFCGLEDTDYKVDKDGKIYYTKEGLLRKDNYTETGLNAYWPFFNVDWYYSVLADPAKREDMVSDREKMVKEIKCVWPENKNTFLFDNTPLNQTDLWLENEGSLLEIKKSIDKYKEKQLLKIILADSDKEFEQLYEELMNTIEDMGINEFDNAYNTKFQYFCDEENIQIENPNHTDENEGELKKVVETFAA